MTLDIELAQWKWKGYQVPSITALPSSWQNGLGAIERRSCSSDDVSMLGDAGINDHEQTDKDSRSGEETEFLPSLQLLAFDGQTQSDMHIVFLLLFFFQCYVLERSMPSAMLPSRVLAQLSFLLYVCHAYCIAHSVDRVLGEQTLTLLRGNCRLSPVFLASRPFPRWQHVDDCSPSDQLEHLGFLSFESQIRLGFPWFFSSNMQRPGVVEFQDPLIPCFQLVSILDLFAFLTHRQ